jgi:tetratricopeptide (TPR) repeat protein
MKRGWIRLPYLFLGEYEKALEIFFKEQNGVEGRGGYWVGRIYMAMGDYDQAIINMEHTVEKSRAPFWLSDLAICYDITGDETKANEIINELIERYNDGEQGSIAFMLGKIYSGLDEVELALEWLERSYHNHELEMIWLYADPQFEILRENEQYIDLLKRVGFDV